MDTSDDNVKNMELVDIEVEDKTEKIVSLEQKHKMKKTSRSTQGRLEIIEQIKKDALELNEKYMKKRYRGDINAAIHFVSLAVSLVLKTIEKSKHSNESFSTDEIIDITVGILEKLLEQLLNSGKIDRKTYDEILDHLETIDDFSPYLAGVIDTCKPAIQLLSKKSFWKKLCSCC